MFQTPPGWMAGAFSELGLKALVLPQLSPDDALLILAGELKTGPSSLLASLPAQGPAKTLMEEIESYFNGENVCFSIPVDWTGYTPFQRLVLEKVKAIPYGETRSYGQVALEAGCPRGARAVGGVMGSNRTPLVIPCHRVIAASGGPGGFGGGLGLKKHLLKLENAALDFRV